MAMEWDVRRGMTVWSSDGHKLGEVVRGEGGGFLIEKGLFFPKDYFASLDQIAGIDGDDVRLAVTADAFKSSGSMEETSRGTAREDATAAAATGRDDDLGLRAGAHEELRVPLAEEELTAEKRMRESGEVRVRKDVVTERREIPVSVTREEVHVERVPVQGGEARGDEARFEKGTVSVPVREEEVEIRKRPVVREEIRVGKTARREERRASGEVRRETAEIEREGDVERADPGLGEPGRVDDPER